MGGAVVRTVRAHKARARTARRAVAGVLCVAAVVAAAAACGSGGGGRGSGHGAHGDTDRPSAAATASGAAGANGATGAGSEGTLSQRELEKAAVGSADLPGWTTNTLTGRGPDGVEVTPVIMDVTRLPRASPAGCAPIGGIAVGPMSPTRQDSAIFSQYVQQKGDSGTMLTESMLAYRPADARGLMADLRASLSVCTSLVFSALAGEDPARYTAPVTRQAPSLGDDAVEFGLTEVVPSVDAGGDDDGGAPVKAPLLFLVLRSGATIVVFSARGFPGEHPHIPAEAVSTQIAKLEQVR